MGRRNGKTLKYIIFIGNYRVRGPDQIAENPYMQYFIGFREFQNEKPFDPGLLVYFRKRFPEEAMNRIIEKMFIKRVEDKDPIEESLVAN